MWQGDKDGQNYTARKLISTGKLPADLPQVADDRFLYVALLRLR